MFRLIFSLPALLLAFVWGIFFPERPTVAPAPAPPVPDANAPDRESLRDGHELSDAQPKLVALMVVGLFAVIFVSMVVLGSMYAHLYTRADAMPVKPMQDSFKYGPRAKTSITRDWETINALAHQRLDGYGWIDHAHGVVRVPITRALDLIAQEGLPARPGQTPDFPAPAQEKLPLTEATTNATKFDPH